MNSNSLMVILTENSWLYMGLSALMPELICVHLRFNDIRLPDIIKEAERLLIVIDSRIILQGEWSALNAIKCKKPDASTVWLIRRETGRLFPEDNRGDRILEQKLDPAALRLAFKRILSGFYEGECAKNLGLTNTERSLLPYFVSDLSMQTICRLTGRDVKTLYTHRHRILIKTGLRLPAFLHLVYKCNQGLPGIVS